MNKPEVACATCSLRDTCLSVGVPRADLDRADLHAFVRRRVRRGERLFHAGDELTCIHAVLAGFFKTVLADREGRDQVTGFFMAGDMLGFDGLGSGLYKDSAIALEDSDVCAMPYSLIEDLAWQVPSMERRLSALLGHEIGHTQRMQTLLGSMGAEQRVAAFLINLSGRLTGQGDSGKHLELRMTREEIGSYLGLKLETVSRSFSSLQRFGLIAVQQKHIAIVDMPGLERAAVH